MAEMEVIQFSVKDRKLQHVRKPKPKITGLKDVVIKIFFSGICRKDLYIIDGTLPCTSDEPTVLLGHEICGAVTEVGADVTLFKRGDRVVVDPSSGCGLCDFCRKGTPYFCKSAGTPNTFTLHRNGSGGWAQYIMVPEHQVFKIPDNIAVEKAVLTEPLACVCHGLDLVSPIDIGKRILLVGTGLIGDLWAAVLHFQGHRSVTVSEPYLSRLEYIKKLDLDYDCVTPEQLKSRYIENPEYVFDLIIDSSNSADAIELDFKLLSIGGKLCICGLKLPNAKISISPYEIYRKEITVIGVNVSSFNFPKALVLLKHLDEKYLDFDNLGVKSYSLKDYERAIAHMKKKSVVKAVFNNTVPCTCSTKNLDGN